MTTPIEQVIDTQAEKVEPEAPVTNTEKVITDATKIADLTVGELKAIMWELLDTAIFLIEQQLPDPDEGKELKPEIAEILRKYQQEKPVSIPAEEVRKRLGLD